MDPEVCQEGKLTLSPVFRTTHWSVVLAAGTLKPTDAHTALERLCETYWYPLYCFIRRKGHTPDDAQDLTQGFFAKLLERNQIELAKRERGLFRTFLLSSLENYLHNEHERKMTQKRGGGREVLSLDAQTAEQRYAVEPMDRLSPEEIYNRRWAQTLLATTLKRLRDEFSTRGRVDLFDSLEPHLWKDNSRTPYSEIAANLCMSESAVKMTLHRLKQNYRDLLREEIAQTVESEKELEDELRLLCQVFAR